MNIPGLSFDDVVFPERKSIVRSDKHLDNIVDEVKKVDLNKVNFEGEDFQPHTKIIQKQKVYLWIRLFIKEEIDITPETKITISYLEGKETLETHFMYFGKKGLERDANGQIVNFNPEDDKRILCLLIDVDNINVNSEVRPYLRTLFPLGKYYTPQYVKKMDFSFLLDDGQQIDFYDIDF
jgi:hypothetical protein